MKSACAMSLLALPAAIRRRTWSSRVVRPAGFRASRTPYRSRNVARRAASGRILRRDGNLLSFIHQRRRLQSITRITGVDQPMRVVVARPRQLRPIAAPPTEAQALRRIARCRTARLAGRACEQTEETSDRARPTASRPPARRVPRTRARLRDRQCADRERTRMLAPFARS